MTDKPNEGENPVDPNEPEVPVEDNSNPDNDPMLTAGEEAEAEIKAQNQEEDAPTSQTTEEDPNADPQDQPKDPEAQEQEPSNSGSQEENNGPNPIMIPKARFDEVLSKNDLLQKQVGYLQGLHDANQGNTQNSNNQEGQNTEPSNEEGSEVDQIDAQITEAEDKKLELAEKYDEGDISTAEMKKAEIEIDREIRGLNDKREAARSEAVRTESKAHTDATVSASQIENQINNEALEVQKNHPNVAVIDKLPQATSAAVWNGIENQALSNLASRGVNLNDNSVQTRVAIMHEKAKLTDQLTPENTQALLMGTYQFVDPAQYKPPQEENGQTNPNEPANKGPTEQAKNLAKKLDLANSQPPSTADMGQGTDTGELTADQFENMTQDQQADLLEKAPQLIQRIAGIQQ